MTITLYGIPNCSTVKKARGWLDSRGIAHTFHDYKKSGTPAASLDRWCREAGWEKIINRAGTTFKKLPQDVREQIDAMAARRLMLEQPSMIKRPIVEHQGGILVGFDAETWERTFAA